MSQQIDLKTKSTLELKALAYDLAALATNYNQMLQVVNQEIGARAQDEQQKQQEFQQSKSLQAVPQEPAASVEVVQ